MLHPHTRVQWIGPQIGYGVFATAFIPRGTAVYVQDALEVVVEADSPLLQDPRYAPIIDRYSFIDSQGRRVLSWDGAKYFNHSCDPNVLSSGWGFEVTVRDINPGEQLTDDYGMFNLDTEMVCCCGAPKCRGVVRDADVKRLTASWDTRVRGGIQNFIAVEQPLAAYIEDAILSEIAHFVETGEHYRSVSALRHRPRRARVMSIAQVSVGA